MKKQLPHILSLSTVAKSRLFEIQAVELKFSNGIDRTYERFRPFNRDSVMVIAIERAETFVSAVNSIGEFEFDSLNFKQAGFCHGGKGENVWKLFFHNISPIILLLAHHTQSERNRKSYG